MPGTLVAGAYRGPRGPHQPQTGGATVRRTFNPPPGLRIGGAEYTPYLIVDSPHIRSTAYPQTGVFSFRLEGAIGGALANVDIEQEVTFNVAGFQYAGRVRNVTPDDLRPGLIGLDVECQDFTILLVDDICAYANVYADPVRSVVETDMQRINWLLQSWGRDGVTAYNVQALYASMPAQDFTDMSLFDAIKAVLKFGGGAFYVDFAKDLHTFVSEPTTAPFALSDSPDGVTSFPYADFQYPRDSVDLRNAVYIIPPIPSILPTVGDEHIEYVTPSGSPVLTVNLGNMAIFRPTPGKRLLRVAVGPLTIGGNASVSPTFGRPTRAGNTLIAWVTARGSFTDSPQPAGWYVPGGHYWSEGIDQNFVVIYAKFDIADNEPIPTFVSGGNAPMHAQIAEFSGIDAWSREADTTGSVSGTYDLYSRNATPAATAGNLVVFVGKWSFATAVTATFNPVMNNNARVFHIGDTGATSQTRHSTFSYGLQNLEPQWYTDETSITIRGRREASLSAPDAVTQTDLDALGAAYLAAHANPRREASCLVDQPGLAAGQVVNVTNDLHGLVAQPFRIQGVETTFSENMPRFAVQFGDSMVDLTTQMVAIQDQIPAASTETAGSTLGTLAYIQKTSNQTGITAQVDVAELSVTVTVAAGRRIRVSAWANCASTVLDDVFRLVLMEGAAQLAYDEAIARPTSTTPALQPIAILTPSAGSHTYKVQAARVVGTGTMSVFGASPNIAFIKVEDVGT